MVMTNAYLLGEGDNCVLIDAPEGVTEWLEKLGELPKEVLLTHQHYDHIQDTAKLSAKGVRVRAYADYSPELTLETYKAEWGIPINVTAYRVHDILGAAEELTSGNYKFRIEYVPGHSTDSIVFITTDKESADEETLVFAGDTLFANSIGRPDLPGGDQELLLDGISKKLLNLADNARVFPGHGPETTIGSERENNPFLK